MKRGKVVIFDLMSNLVGFVAKGSHSDTGRNDSQDMQRALALSKADRATPQIKRLNRMSVFDEGTVQLVVPILTFLLNGNQVGMKENSEVV